MEKSTKISPMLGLRTAIYKVEDLDQARKWYSDVFQVLPYFDKPFYVGFNISGYELGLQPQDPAIKKTANVISYWGVENIQSEFDRLIHMGAIEYEKPTNVGGEIMTAVVLDPWDNALGLIYNPEFALS